jgi:hypothetical protein
MLAGCSVQDEHGRPIPTLCGGTTMECAWMETVFSSPRNISRGDGPASAAFHGRRRLPERSRRRHPVPYTSRSFRLEALVSLRSPFFCCRFSTGLLSAALLLSVGAARAEAADEAPELENSLLRFQSTYIWQKKPGFSAGYTGPNSLITQAERSYTFTADAYLGLRPGRAASCISCLS